MRSLTKFASLRKYDRLLLGNRCAVPCLRIVLRAASTSLADSLLGVATSPLRSGKRSAKESLLMNVIYEAAEDNEDRLYVVKGGGAYPERELPAVRLCEIVDNRSDLQLYVTRRISRQQWQVEQQSRTSVSKRL